MSGLTDDEINLIIFQSHGKEHAALRQLAAKVVSLGASERTWIDAGNRAAEEVIRLRELI